MRQSWRIRLDFLTLLMAILWTTAGTSPHHHTALTKDETNRGHEEENGEMEDGRILEPFQLHKDTRGVREKDATTPSSLSFRHENLQKRFEADYWPMSNSTEQEEGEEGGEEEANNCTHPRQPLPRYNDSCDFVHAECEGQAELIDYLAFVLCDLPKAQARPCNYSWE